MDLSQFDLYVDSQYASPYAMSAFVALTEKGLPFQMKRLDLDSGDHQRPAYAAASLTHRVPTLVHEGFNLSESSAIAEYLDDVYPMPMLYPRAPKLRARARQVQAWLRSDLMALRQERSTEVVFFRPTSTPLSPEARACAAKLFTAAKTLLAHGDQHLFGHWSIADVDLALMLNRLALNGDAIPRKLEAYAQHQWRRASVQAWLSQPRGT